MIAALLLVGLRQALAGYLHEYSFVSDGFFSEWNFVSRQDPTHGTVNYVGQEEAEAAGLVRATADRIYMGVDMEAVLPAGAGRRAVRVESRSTFSEGLFVLQAEHVPTGCGSWPAFWMYGEDPTHPWPAWGEFDIIEGVHTATRVMTTLHTTPHCRQDQVAFGSVAWGTGRHGGPATNCYVSAPEQWPNQGCTQRGPESTIGAAFNAAGGGTYAAEWDPQAGHIQTWFWPRGSEPPDLLLRQPSPETWGPAYSYFRIDPGNCDPAHFQQMRLVFDITFCGDMGDPTFADHCPDKASQGLRCQDFVRLHPEEMTEAYWSISGLDVYIRGQLPVVQPEPRPSNPWNWLYVLACVGALTAVASLYALVWIKVQKDAGESNRFTALYDQYRHLLSGATGSLPSVPWNRLAAPLDNTWSRLALDEKDQKVEDDVSRSRYQAQGGPHRLGGGLSGGPPAMGARSAQRGRSTSPQREASTATGRFGFTPRDPFAHGTDNLP